VSFWYRLLTVEHKNIMQNHRKVRNSVLHFMLSPLQKIYGQVLSTYMYSIEK